MLWGRAAEQAWLEGLVAQARGGRSAAVTVEVEPGIGKTSLLAHAVAKASGFTVVRVQGLEAEAELAFAGLSDLVRPILHLRERIPVPQQAALSSALALGPPVPGDRFAVAAATLRLLAVAAEQGPVLAVVDDAQWLDRPSREALLFAGRRLGNEGVLLLIGTRHGEWVHETGLDTLELHGLSPEDAAALADNTGRSIDPAVRDRLVAETRGNPMAMLEAIATMSEAELRGTAPIAHPLVVGASLERAFAQQLDGLPEDTRRALLIAAASDTASAAEIERALAGAGLPADALEPAERDGVVALVGERVEFRHPLVRSAAYHLHDPVSRRAAHRALAAALGAGERAAWHLAARAQGRTRRSPRCSSSRRRQLSRAARTRLPGAPSRPRRISVRTTETVCGARWVPGGRCGSAASPSARTRGSRACSISPSSRLPGQTSRGSAGPR